MIYNTVIPRHDFNIIFHEHRNRHNQPSKWDRRNDTDLCGTQFLGHFLLFGFFQSTKHKTMAEVGLAFENRVLVYLIN
ncbi:hypothetical protein D3C81_1265500 [compost metagenome]